MRRGSAQPRSYTTSPDVNSGRGVLAPSERFSGAVIFSTSTNVPRRCHQRLALTTAPPNAWDVTSGGDTEPGGWPLACQSDGSCGTRLRCITIAAVTLDGAKR